MAKKWLNFGSSSQEFYGKFRHFLAIFPTRSFSRNCVLDGIPYNFNRLLHLFFNFYNVRRLISVPVLATPKLDFQIDSQIRKNRFEINSKISNRWVWRNVTKI